MYLCNVCTKRINPFIFAVGVVLFFLFKFNPNSKFCSVGNSSCRTEVSELAYSFITRELLVKLNDSSGSKETTTQAKRP